jgi:spore coat polysaccharide biosynthesis predicted glycosyltransferase SpsG
VSDIVLNQNLNAEKNFQYSCEEYTKLLLGKEYVLLRREFRKFISKPSYLNKEAKNILITFGGSDPENYTEKIINYLKLNVNNGLLIKAILGPNNVHQKRIEEFIRVNHIPNAEIIFNPEDLIKLFLWSDIVISSSGTIVWEVLRLNKPILLIPIADNQILNSKELKDIYKPNIDYISIPENEDKILNFIENYKNLNSPLNYNYHTQDIINNIFNN